MCSLNQDFLHIICIQNIPKLCNLFVEIFCVMRYNFLKIGGNNARLYITNIFGNEEKL